MCLCTFSLILAPHEAKSQDSWVHVCVRFPLYLPRTRLRARILGHVSVYESHGSNYSLQGLYSHTAKCVHASTKLAPSQPQESPSTLHKHFIKALHQSTVSKHFIQTLYQGISKRILQNTYQTSLYNLLIGVRYYEV